MTLRVLSLFSGVGGLELGLERAGMVTVGQCEMDPFARAVLEKHWPGIPRWTDVRTVTGDDVRERCGRVDVVCGGFPCQDISIAGKRGGIDAPRSGLWRELVRVVAEVAPRVVVVENIFAGWRQWVPVVRGALHGAGYPSLPVCLPASHLGAKHARRRVFVVADTDAARLADVARRTGSPWSWLTEPGAPDWCGARVAEWPAEPGVVRVVHGVSSGLDARDRIAALGNAVVPAVAEVIGRAIVAAESTP